MNKLAIVIPAFKATYFNETLDCFVKQTNKNFHIYIGDDHSNSNLEELILPYFDKLPLTYYRFETNIGAKHIVDQWERSISLTKDEEWIWLFSDDDLVDENAVEVFWNIVAATHGSKDIYSFNTCVINKTGGIISNPPDVPSFETSEEMAYNLLIGKRANCMPDHIFTRAIFKKNKGFVKTVYGQGADWANSILFSSANGYCLIPGALVYWRFSGDNISSVAFRHKSQMIKGHFQFIRWILLHFNYLKEERPEDFEKIRDAARQNLLSVIGYHYKGVPFSKLLYFAWFMRRYFYLPTTHIISLVRKMNTYHIAIENKKKQTL
jgi:glycosyltransferase involved in cell wall biosynthesis